MTCSSRKIRCSEITSEAIFVPKFIFGLDGVRILRQSVFGAPLTMLHGSQSLVVTCGGYQCQMCALQSIGAKHQIFRAEAKQSFFFYQQSILQAHVYVPSNIAVDKY